MAPSAWNPAVASRNKTKSLTSVWASAKSRGHFPSFLLAASSLSTHFFSMNLNSKQSPPQVSAHSPSLQASVCPVPISFRSSLSTAISMTVEVNVTVHPQHCLISFWLFVLVYFPSTFITFTFLTHF